MFFQGFGSDTKLKIGMKTVERFSAISHEDCNDVASSMLERIKTKLIASDWTRLPVRLDSRLFTVDLPLEVYSKAHYEEELAHYSGGAGIPFHPKCGRSDTPAENARMLYWFFADYIVSHYDTLPETLTLSCGLVRINSNFYICYMGGEPAVNIQTILREAFPDVTLLCFGYANAVAYVPSDKVIAEGGYEAEGSVTEYRLKGRIAPGVDEIFRRGYKQAMAELNETY